MTEMTVLEFAAHHVETEHCPTSIKHHVDLLIVGALNRKRTLWGVRHDEDGRPVLTWLSMDERIWAALLEEIVRAAANAELEAHIAAEVDEFLGRVFPS